MASSEISNNTANGRGGGLFSTGTVSLAVVLVTDSIAGSGPVGGIDQSGGSLSVVSGYIARNAAPEGGGIHASSPLSVVDSTFLDNTAGTGGALQIGPGHEAAITNVVFTGN